MIPFLKSVAQAYAAVPHSLLSRYCFLFPNKRSAAFFRKYLAESLPEGEALLSPRLVTISDLMEELSGLTVDSHIDLLFSLYNCYVSLIRGGKVKNIDSAEDAAPGDPQGKDNEEPIPDFDSFVRWGETVLQDFNDVDLFCVDNRVVFKNVEDFRKISANYLTEEQKYVMREYFNFEPSTDELERFWNSFPKDNGKNGSRRFRLLWEVLSPLYEKFSDLLDSEGLATQGGAYRVALRRIREKGRDMLPFSRIVVVGFNVLTMVEYNIFKEFQKMKCEPEFAIENSDSFADFFWDATGPVLTAEIKNSASRFVQFNKKEFPSPEWAYPIVSASDKDSLPDLLEAIASPSNAMQAKIAAEIVERDLRGSGEVKDFSDANVAVVLPDESLLFPLLYSLPDNLEINLTMGYPLRQTTALTFVGLLRRLLMKRRAVGGRGIVVYKPDLSALLGHPFVQALDDHGSLRHLGDVIASFRGSEMGMTDIVEAIGVCPLSDFLQQVMTLPKQKGDLSAEGVVSILRHVNDIVMSVKRSLLSADFKRREVAEKGVAPEEGKDNVAVSPESGEEVFSSPLDIAHLDIYSDALRRMEDTILERGVPMSEQTALYLADRLLGAEKVEFEGEPLRGLQVIGLLETRGLDFEYLVIPSLNERIFPRKARSRSFIPDALRHAYGMPPSNYQESLFSYYFYRMLSRAKKVWMIYDARVSTGGRNFEPSRYLTQLRYLHAPDRLVTRECGFVIPENSFDLDPIEKTEAVMEKLSDFLWDDTPFPGLKAGKPGVKNFSASALQRYLDCPAKFYYEFVEGINDKNTFSENIDALSQGNIYHKAMEEIYCMGKPHNPADITAEYIGKVVSAPEKIKEIVLRAVATEHFGAGNGKDADPEAEIKQCMERFPGSVDSVADGIVDQVIATLRHDLLLTPFRMLGSEVKGTLPLTVTRLDGSGDFRINMRFAIDRLDVVNVVTDKKSGARETFLRIVDYKTGKAHNTASDVEGIFSEFGAKNMFQLMLYARMLQVYQSFPGLRHLHTSVCGKEEVPDAAMEIYEVGAISGNSKRNVPEVDKEAILRFSQCEEEYNRILNEKLNELFDPAVPFVHTDNPRTCSYCHLRTLCRR